MTCFRPPLLHPRSDVGPLFVGIALVANLFFAGTCQAAASTKDTSTARKGSDAVFTGVVAREAALRDLVSKIGARLGPALEATAGATDLRGREGKRAAEPRVSDIQRLLDDTRGRYNSLAFEDAKKRAADGIAIFQSKLAFRNNPDAWDIWAQLMFLRAMAMQRTGDVTGADQALAAVAAAQPLYIPDPSFTPPKVGARFQKVLARLKKSTTVSLNIQSRPPAAVVVVDGRDVGETPLKVSNLLPGMHYVAVVKGNQRFEEKVALRRGQRTLKANLGDPRQQKARALNNALEDGLDTKQLAGLAQALDTNVYVSVLESDKTSASLRLLLGKIIDGALVSVTAVTLADDLGDLDHQVHRLAVTAFRADSDTSGEGRMEADLRLSFLGQRSLDARIGAVALGQTGLRKNPPEGSSADAEEPGDEAGFPTLLVASGVGVVALLAAATGAAAFVYLNRPPNPGGTDVVIDASQLP